VGRVTHQWRRLGLLARRQYLQMLLNAAVFDEGWHANEALLAGMAGEEAKDKWLSSQAANDRLVAQRLRVELARVEAALWPVRGAS
jgi:hypothetical protein